MKSFRVIIAIMLALISTCLVFFVLSQRGNTQLKKIITDKKNTIQKAMHAKKKIEVLEGEIEALKNSAAKVKSMLASDEQSILELVKKVTLLGRECGFIDMRFSYTAVKEADSEGGAVPVRITMDFQSDFSSVVRFCKEVTNLDMVVSVERLSVERRENLLPRQAVSLLLTTYLY